MRLSAAIGATLGSFAAALVVMSLWTAAPSAFVAGVVTAAYLVGAALGRIAWGT